MIYAFEHHDELLGLWRRQDARGLRLAHVDFHDDLRGLLLDRRRGEARAIGTLARGAAPVDPGNFLAHAVLEGRIESLRWIHDLPGGRAWDLGIVRYESDWLAPLRRRPRTPWQPLDFEERLLEDWNGPQEGERLSLDWDCFASRLIPRHELDRRVATFLERLGGRVPQDTYLAYSTDYCHPTLAEFLDLVARLAERHAQPVEWLSRGLREGRLHPAGDATAIDSGPLARCVLALRRRGIYF